MIKAADVLDVALPLTSSDLRPEDVSRVRGLLCRVMDYYTATMQLR
jgi:hypothetical protein